MIFSRTLPSLLSVCLVVLIATNSIPAAPPHLAKKGTATQLLVQGEPFIMLAGEVYNSSSSNLGYLAPIWPRLGAMNLNTVLVPVSWEQLEPVEGKFDFTLVDGVIDQARKNRLRVVLLWFGTWKNMVSSYAPAWFRADPKRFPLVIDDVGNGLPIPSPFSAAGQAADARAFAALMKHLRKIDEAQQTVLMVQVENEVGLPNSLRDRSPVAQAAFTAPIPGELALLLHDHPDRLTRELRAVWDSAGGRTSGSWAEIFGDGPAASELFMAWHYARYINAVASAGRAEYPVPLFVNAAIGRKDGKIGSYPGGGALPLAFNVWQLAAPEIQMLSPDIYYGNFDGWCRSYSQAGNPFFIPETHGQEIGAANAFLAIAGHNAMGFSPFGIDDPAPSSGEFARAYDVLKQLTPLILAHQGDGSMNAAVLNHDNPSQTLTLGGYTLTVAIRRPRKSVAAVDSGYALIIAEQPDRFVVAGKDVDITFAANGTLPAVVELNRVEEGIFLEGRWVPGRRLNGDEIMLDYGLSTLAAKNQTGTGLRFGAEGPTIIRATVFRREPVRQQ